jgi:hypothetical protein
MGRAADHDAWLGYFASSAVTTATDRDRIPDTVSNMRKPPEAATAPTHANSSDLEK